jgi:hypothetical protein
MKSRFQFPLYKLFWVTAIYALCFGLLSRFGPAGVEVAVLVGSSGSIFVLAVSARRELLVILIVVAGTCAIARLSFLGVRTTLFHLVEIEWSSPLVMIWWGIIAGPLILAAVTKRQKA